MSARGAAWPWAMAAILTVTVLGNLWVLRLAGSDASFAVEEDYYRRAVSWDSAQARRTRSQSTGWRTQVQLGQEDETGARLVSVALLNADGTPIEGARVAAEARHLARSADPRRLDLVEASPGRYTASLDRARAGLWEVRLDVTARGVEYVATHRLDTARGAPR